MTTDDPTNVPPPLPGAGAPVADDALAAAARLKDAGRVDEALAAWQGLLDAHAASTAPALRREAARALYAMAWALVEGGAADQVVDGLAAQARPFDDCTDPVVRERVAKAWYLRAMALDGLERSGDAADACEDIVRRFAADGGDDIGRIVAGARHYERLIHGLARATFDGASDVVDLDPALRLAIEAAGDKVAGVLNVIDDGGAATRPPPLTMAEVLEFLRGPRYEALPEADADARDWLAKRELIRSQLERDLAGHLRCADILHAHLTRRDPFALFLRNFDIEGYLARGHDGPRVVRLSLQFTAEGLLESRLASAVGALVPFVGVGNNAPVRPDFEQKIPRMMLANALWQGVVEELVRAASLIVMDVVRLTPGVIWELDTVRRLGAQDRTVVVLSEPRDTESIGAIAQAGYGAERPPHRPATKDSPELASFPRVVTDADVAGDMAQASWMADLLQDVRTEQATEPAARRRWDGVVF